ncbi:DUF2252 family protein [Caulobacter sp. S45]|uniref:DUF2252 family protein n=1 Tax=Caulobacter sp. S45 TaxID=1641861 RepID=UPI001C206A38|nr:DUF2252 family protein [Caulobacter sp. S45]
MRPIDAVNVVNSAVRAARTLASLCVLGGGVMMSDEAKDVERTKRAKVLEQRRTLKMARSAHAYVRGNTVKFYEWLATADADLLPAGPPIWICGDCHVGNLGPLADADGRIDVQIRDLDQTVIGNPAHDLVRLGLSLATAARGSDLPGVTTARMVEEMVRGYSVALRDPNEEDAVPEPGVVKSVKRQAFGRKWKHLARERIKDVSPSIPRGKKFWSVTVKEQEAISVLFEQDDVRRLVLSLNARADESALELVDLAYWMKGCSSLGKLRFAALIALKGGGRKDQYAMVDLKEAVAAAAPAATRVGMPTHHGARVVTGARALSPNLGDRMMAADILGRPVVLRELAPQDLKLEIDQFSRKEAVIAARYLAYVVGRAHARQMDDATRSAWAKELERRRPADMDAPNWLWSSVVALAGRHEQGYLEHCRRYALETAA